ncbi:sigma 54-interacting transcriptional regulator [Clostridium estertheticum]|uniref:Sigma-54-dependent Fis family transcriptional regulator n=1 Tax=Clostridium estertheticum subsp. estertheticum TaxID=1552 RepID=A0A1J0GCI3_9CLOT|nr:sigma 54-interacting transcriptional regulator [Clostridium estertheticum]APC38995.1 sigma-54-dependent Fis family transcriptional regulator [Clostridium estertheticum subsp. estertheticum]MBZ9615046.1 sigma 54-interacting transcriptional regulator [Clostridium estertheticum subsp. laramiense]WAG74948.1 sigma 54-interacting transcriptional regulator [Clostridium estertheticum]
MDVISDYYNEVMNNINEGIVVIDKRGIIQIINNAAERMFEIDADNSIGEYILDVLSSSKLISIIENGEAQVNKKDGKFIVTRKLITQSGEVIGAFEVFHEDNQNDLLMNVQDDGRVQEEMLNTIFNTVNECIVVVDQNGIITMMSDEYKRFINCQNPEGKHVTEVIENTKLHIVARTGEKKVGEIQEVNGHRMISMRVPIIKDGVVVGAIGKVMFKDLSNFKILSNKLCLMDKEAEGCKNELSTDQKAIYTFNNIIGGSDKSQEVMVLAKRVAKVDSNVLITGESGTGKELFAHSIHNDSKRCLKPFVKINCGAIPAELFESEMFGYEEGAFTGAKKSGRKGKFEYANGGTILLDEIGDMPMNMQVKLLRVIQEKELVKVGGNDAIKVDVRIIASTNKSLEQLINDGKFREDLYYRLDVMHLRLPPLRERREDIEELANKLLIKICKKYNVKSEGISREAIDFLKAYSWPGNIRQLENVIERAINLLDEDICIMPKHLPEKIIKSKSKKYSLENNYLKDVVERIEKDIIMECLKDTSGNKKEAAKILGLSRAGLYKKLNRYNLIKSTNPQ